MEMIPGFGHDVRSLATRISPYILIDTIVDGFNHSCPLLPSGKAGHHLFLIGKSTSSMELFNSYVKCFVGCVRYFH